MKYTTLGGSGAAVSRLALGTMYFGQQTPEEDAFAILDTFLEAGGTLIDTADVYVGGTAEETIGKWFASRPRDVTDRVVLTSKGRQPTGKDVNNAGLSRRHLHRALDASLKRLQVETIDLYQLHSSDPYTPMEETIRFLDDAVRAGKIHYVGLSNFNGWELQRFVSTAKELGAVPPVTLQPQYSLLSREIEWEIAPAARANAIGLLPWSPLAGGFLTGKYARGQDAPSDTRAGSDSPLYQFTSAEYAEIDRNWRTIDAVKRIAEQIGATPAQVSLSWIADRPGVTAPICGARTVEHLKDNLGALDVQLDAELTRTLEEVSRPRPYGYPYGPFGIWQRERGLENGSPAPEPVYGDGSDNPTG
ncbi:aldo/keto reductase [Sphingomonas sp.]|uniref:aldo/keto reductase n=1 Tax=Sphingomonas sp. TaxID=28214 RepID=UPI0035C87169